MEDEAADIELLEQHLIKTNNISQRMTSILVNFDNRLSRLEKSILPLHKSTQSLSRLAENIEATLQSIDKIASNREGIAAEEQMILRGPRPDDLTSYIDVVERLNANIAFASNDPRASRDTARMVETGVKKLCQLYTKLIAEGSSGAPPSGPGIKWPGFPSYLYDSLDPLVAALRALPLPATHPSHPAAPTILKTLTEAQKGYGEMRGAFCKKCLEAMGGRRIIDRIETIPGIQGGKEIGVWIEGIITVAESEYQLLGRLAPLPGISNIQPTFSTLLTPSVTMTSTTLTLLITLIKGSLTKYTFLALATYEALGNVQSNWDDVIRKTGRKENEVKDSVNSLRAVCLRSFPEFLLDVRAAGTKTNVEVGTGLHEITTLATSYLTQIPAVLDAVGSALVTLGDGMWKMGEGAGKVFGKSDQDDERVVIEHFIYDIITALLGSLSNLANASKRPAHSSIFHLNNVSYLRNRLLLAPETSIDDLLSKPSQDALNSAYRTAKAVYFDANFSPLIQALGDMGGKKDAKEKITRFFDALDEVCDRHRTSRILPDEPEGREMLEDEVVRLVGPALTRFNQKNPSLASKGSGKLDMSSRRYSSKPAPAGLAATERSEQRPRSKNPTSTVPEQRRAPAPDHRREYQDLQERIYSQTNDAYYTQYEDERPLSQPSPPIPVYLNVSSPMEERLAERTNIGSRRSGASSHARRKEHIQWENNVEGGRVPHLPAEGRPLNDNEGHAQDEAIAPQRRSNTLSGDRGEQTRYAWQNERLSPQSPAHAPSYVLSSDDENHRPREYDNHARRQESNLSGRRRGEGPHTLQTETSNSWRSDPSHHSRSHIRPPNALPVRSKSRTRGQYAVSSASGYGRSSPIPNLSSVDSPSERGKVLNSPSGPVNSPSLLPSIISSPPAEDRQRRRISKQPPSRTLVGSLPVSPATAPSITLFPENIEFASSSRQRSLVSASPITHSTSKWTSSVPSPPLSPLLMPDSSVSASASATQRARVTPGKAITRPRRNTLSRPDTVSSPATPYATAPEDSFHSHVTSGPHMQGEDKIRDGRKHGHDYGVQDSSEKRRRTSNPAPFRGEITEHVERTQPNLTTKRNRRESNAAGLIQQAHDAPSNASASARSRRSSLSASRAADTIPVRDEPQRFREHGAGRMCGTKPASALVREDSRETPRTGWYHLGDLPHDARPASRASKDDDEDPYTIVAVTESISGYESRLQTGSEYEGDRRSTHHQRVSDGSDRGTPNVLYEEKKHNDLLAKLGLGSGDSRPVGLGLSVVHREGESGGPYRIDNAENYAPVESYRTEDSTFPRPPIESNDSRLPYHEPQLEPHKVQGPLEPAYDSRRRPKVDRGAHQSPSPPPFMHKYEGSPAHLSHLSHLSHASTPPESSIGIPTSASMTPKKDDRKRKSYRPPPLEIRRSENPTPLRSPAIIVQEVLRTDEHSSRSSEPKFYDDRGTRDSLANKPGTTVWTPVEEEAFHRSPWDGARPGSQGRDSTFSVPTEEERAAGWSETESLSPGARKLFEGLQDETRQPSSHPRPEQISLQSTPQEGYRDNHRDDSLPSTKNTGRPMTFEGAKTWKGTLSVSAYDNLLERHGIIEMKRQDVIWELCETETSFVKSLKTILRLFVQPLRSSVASGEPNAGKWIPGLPREPMKLFDWLDDIVQLHTQISSALHLARSTQYPVVLHIAEHLRPFVPRLELHLPYLARLAGVTEEIDRMARDPESDFGEFIRLQSSNPECESLGLSSFLLKPVQRLMKYPLFFKQLFEMTPRSHPDHLPTFSLLHSTDLVIRVMQEVKAREEEYDYVKSLAARIAGMPPGFKLARRERRLIAQGLLRRILLNEKEEATVDGLIPASPSTLRTPSGTPTTQPPTPQPSSPITPSIHGIDLTKLGPVTSPYFTNQSIQTLPISPVYNHRRSFMSMISRASGVSDSSEWTASYSPHTSMAGPLEPDMSHRPDSTASSIAYVASPFASQHDSPTLRTAVSKDHQKSKPRDMPIYAFVFSDLIILTAPNPEKQSSLRTNRTPGSKDSMQLAEQVGVSRVLGVVDHSGKLDMDYLIAVDLLPMPQDQPDTGLLSADASSARPIYLTLPDKSNARLNLAPPQALSDAKDKWVTAFQRCFRFTLRSLSFPLSTRYDDPADGELGSEGHSRSSVMSILASGLPLPKSPSQQLFQSAEDASSVEDIIEGEREERGWWTLRFKQVLREMEQLGDPVMLIGDSALTMGYRPKRAQMPERTKRSGPQPLLLSSIATQSGSSGSKENRKSLLPSFKRR